MLYVLFKTPVYIYLKHNISEIGFSLHLQAEPTQLYSGGIASPYLRTPAPTQDNS
jgi:hypothetical protein